MYTQAIFSLKELNIQKILIAERNRCRLNCILAGKKLKFNLQKTVKTYSVEIDGPWVGIIL